MGCLLGCWLIKLTMNMETKTITAPWGTIFRCKCDGQIYGREVTPGLVFYDAEGNYVPDGIMTTEKDYEMLDCARLVTALIRRRYTLDDEFAMNRQRYEKPEEWAEYYQWCETCKKEAKALIYGEE